MPGALPSRSSPPPAYPPNPELHPARSRWRGPPQRSHRLVAGVAAPLAAGYRYAPGGLAARRFPLAPRPKPPCRPLTERLARVARLADEVADDADAPLRAAGACNLAALIASDCAMPDLARALCWTQFEAYSAARPEPCGENTAKLILQPLVNLARLRIRGGEADAGRQILQSLYDAARSSSGQAVIDGRAVSLPTLATPAREALTQWLWAVLLTDSLRALCKAGRWTDALRQAQQHDGIGQRLLDGRQVAVVAHASASEQEEARRILRETSASEPWEHVVILCLRALTGESAAEAVTTMTGAYLAFSDPGHPWFTACLGLTVAELAAPGDGRHAAIGKAASIATESRDAYIAAEILKSPLAGTATRGTVTDLNGMVIQSGLGQPLTAVQEKHLTASASAAAALLAVRLSTGV